MSSVNKPAIPAQNQPAATTRFNGIVVWFDARKGYGFIQRDNGQPDLFVHFSDISSQGFKTLKKDQRVTFTIGTNKKGQPKAADVQALQ